MRAGDALIPSEVQACESPAYHRSNAIQPHCVFLAMEPCRLHVARASANAVTLFARPIEDILGIALSDLLAPGSMQRVGAAVQTLRDDSGLVNKTSLAIEVVGARANSAAAILYRSGDLLCIEIELPWHGLPAGGELLLTNGFFELVEGVARASGPSAGLPNLACAAIRAVTGFDRVYFCEFDRYGHGHVQGESNGGALPLLIDHHFPATDIPRGVRDIFSVNQSRAIPNVDAPAVRIVGGDGTALDLTLSTCRAPAETHLRYLRNMGVAASMSHFIVVDGRLQALIGGHHRAPRRLSSAQTATCRHLVDLFGIRLDFLKFQEERVALYARIGRLDELYARFRTVDCDLGAFVASNHATLCAMMGANDLLCRFGGESHLGLTLKGEQASELLDFLVSKSSAEGEIHTTDCLSNDDTRFTELVGMVAGALVVSFDQAGGSVIAWLRAETVVVKTWSGDPDRAVLIGAGGGAEPRSSFIAYLRETKGTSLAWSPTDIQVAKEVRRVFSQMLVERFEITMRRAAEQANALKSEFIANVSHELKSPMHAIIGFSDMLASAGSDMPDDKIRRYAGTINSSGHRLLRLIDDLLSLSQLEAGKMNFNMQVGDLRTTLERAIAALEVLARGKEIAVHVRDLRSIERTRFDSSRMEQVITNLVSNAIKFSPRCSDITLTLQTRLSGTDDEQLIVEIADKGVGIPAGELDAIFGKFVQSSRTKTGAGGTGLGLAITREIIEMHGGRIWATNNPGGGASFSFQIPQTTERRPGPLT